MNEIEDKVSSTLTVSSTAFAANADIPSKYTCDGADSMPPISIKGIPSHAKSLAFIMDDPDSPTGTWVHWVLFDAPITAEIEEGKEPQGTKGTNTWGKTGYGGPCPGSGAHHYHFKVYAIDTKLGLHEGSTKEEVLAAMDEHVLAEGELVGIYQRR